MESLNLKPIYHKPLNRDIVRKFYSVGQVLSIPAWGIVGSIIDNHYSWLHRNWLYCVKADKEEVWVGQGSGVRVLPDVSPIYSIGIFDN